ncbi:hypothetical protein [Streptomyces tubercidicus]|uniref:hypothetical protein n=1 Tax=Streptomyces tubercidicus TaxID=47759 RepID=UPI0036A2DC1D
MAWLLAEDAALKKKLTGISVTGSAVSRPIPVDVRMSVPEDEFADFTYPLIVITQVDVIRATERESSGFIELRALPEGFSSGDGPYFANFPTPHDIDYQIVLYTRLNQHRTELVGRLAHFEYLPERFGFLDMPGDNTVRRLDLIGGPEMSAGRDKDDKRLFTATYRIRVSTELFILGDPVAFPPVQTVEVKVNDHVPGHQA